MAHVVSNTTPLHYLILIGCDSILPKLYGEILVPPAVLEELRHPAAPREVSSWAASPPGWLLMRAPSAVPGRFANLDRGEREALALAGEVRAQLVLLDDKVARRCAKLESLKVKGTLGIVADAASKGWLDFHDAVRRLRRTSMHLEPKLAESVVREYERNFGRKPEH